MRRWLAATLAAACLAACAEQKPSETPGASSAAVSTPGAPDAAAPSPSGDFITPDGIGALRIGMSLDDLEKVAGTALSMRTDPDFSPADCVEGNVPNGPADTVSMVEKYKLTRLSTANESLRTVAGIRVGDTEEAVRRAYGAKLTSTPHTYTAAPAAYLTVWEKGDGSQATSRGLQFVTDEQRIVRVIHAGGQSIGYVEGCL